MLAETIPMPWPHPAAPPASGMAALPVRSVGLGIHEPATVRRHADRTLPVHELNVVEAAVLPNTEATTEHDVREGQWILLRAGMRHDGTRDLDDRTWFRWICFTCEPTVMDQGPTPTGFAQDRREIAALFARYLADRDEDRLTQQAADAYTTLILHRLAAADRGSMSNDERLRHLTSRHVADHLDDPDLTTATIAAALGYHPDHLGRAFRTVANVPITTYIHRERVDHARTLLRTTDVAIDRVAAASGFRDVRYFRRIFVRHAGVSPSAYRSVHR
jgi:AraC-like DNA-binding protein